MDQQFQALHIATKAEETKAEPALPFAHDDSITDAEVVVVAVANEPEEVPLPLNFGLHPPAPVPEPVPPVRRQRRVRNREISQADIEAQTRPLPTEQQMRSDPVAQEVLRVLMDVKEPSLRLPASIVELAAGYAVTTVCDVWRECNKYLQLESLPGATDEEIKKVEQDCGFALPSEMTMLLQYANCEGSFWSTGLFKTSTWFLNKEVNRASQTIYTTFSPDHHIYIILDAKTGFIYQTNPNGPSQGRLAYIMFPSIRSMLESQLKLYETKAREDPQSQPAVYHSIPLSSVDDLWNVSFRHQNGEDDEYDDVIVDFCRRYFGDDGYEYEPEAEEEEEWNDNEW